MATAKRGAGWRSGRRGMGTRPVQMTRHLVVSEGTETEPRYFEGLRDALGAANGRKLAVVVKGSGLHTLDLLEWAQEYCRRAPDTFDHVWLVFDKDDFPAADFDETGRRCEALGSSPTFHALWSNPCFELWPLLHLRYTTAPMDAATCQRALSGALSRELGRSYAKNMDGLFGALEPLRPVAEGNVAKLEGHHESLGNGRPSEMVPCTRVGDIFREIGPYLRGGGGDAGK